MAADRDTNPTAGAKRLRNADKAAALTSAPLMLRWLKDEIDELEYELLSEAATNDPSAAERAVVEAIDVVGCALCLLLLTGKRMGTVVANAAPSAWETARRRKGQWDQRAAMVANVARYILYMG